MEKKRRMHIKKVNYRITKERKNTVMTYINLTLKTQNLAERKLKMKSTRASRMALGLCVIVVQTNMKEEY